MPRSRFQHPAFAMGRRRRISGAALLAAALLCPGPVAAESLSVDLPPELASLRDCVASNLPESSGRIEFAVEVIDRTGEITPSRAELLWHRDGDGSESLLLRVSEPAHTAGTALLMRDDSEGSRELFVYLPELEKVKRVRNRRLKGPVLGTDFSFEDLSRLGSGIGRTRLRALPDREGADGRLRVVEARPDAEDRSGYERIVSTIDAERCLPVRVEFFEADERLRKVLTSPADQAKRHGRGWLPGGFEMHDLRNDTRTRIRIERVDVETALSRDLFTRGSLLASGRGAERP